MKVKCYSIKDTKAGCFGTPFFCMNDEVAKRMFEDLSMDPKTLVSKHPNDFILFGLGDFDDDNGELIGLSNGPINLGFVTQKLGLWNLKDSGNGKENIKVG